MSRQDFSNVSHARIRVLATAACLLATACTRAAAPTAPERPVTIQPTTPANADGVASPPRAEPTPVAPDPEHAQSLGATGIALGPVELDISALPVADYPPMLMAGNAPSALPAGASNPLKRKPSVPLSHGGLGRGHVEIENQRLARLQVGKVRLDGWASSKYRLHCQDDIDKWRAAGPPPQRPRDVLTSPFSPRPQPDVTHQGITPARWEVLTRTATGKVVLTITDAWFDNRTCRAAVQNVTTIEPQRLLDGLVYAFRGRCDDCKRPDVVTFVSPHFRSASIGGRPFARGAFSIFRMPNRPRIGSQFVGFSDHRSMQRWSTVASRATPAGRESQRALFGLELKWDIATKRHVLIVHGART